MNSKNILVLGSRGMLGRYVFKFLKQNGYNIKELNRPEYDALDGKLETLLSIDKIKNLKKGDFIINCIGLLPHTFNDNSISNNGCNNFIFKKFILINTILPNNLEKIKLLKYVNVLNITSDCVFSGIQGKYNELDSPDYMWAYGITKTLGECSRICNIRSSIIGEEQKSKRSLLEWVKSNKNSTINGYTNYLWNGVTCLQMAKVINKIINEELIWEGTRHIFSPKEISKYDLVKLINETYNLNIFIKAYDLPNSIDRTLSSIYSYDFGIPDISQQIKDLFEWENE
tara:strand:- start:54 stop:908 length:855 start_codon:yes stop_codon:yes gene_type:complete